jgi:hypothetical protein
MNGVKRLKIVISVNISRFAKPREVKLIKEEGDGRYRREDDKIRSSAANTKCVRLRGSRAG